MIPCRQDLKKTNAVPTKSTMSKNRALKKTTTAPLTSMVCKNNLKKTNAAPAKSTMSNTYALKKTNTAPLKKSATYVKNALKKTAGPPTRQA